MKIAVTGPKGQLGSELVRQGCVPLYGRLSTKFLIEEIDRQRPDVIINCAAMTDVDGCETNALRAMDVNAAGVEHLSQNFTGYLIQISTDYIFDGRSGPYAPNDPPNPISIYGWSKLGGELITRRHRGPWLIVRTTILFSQAANNFVMKVVKQLAEGAKVLLYQPDLVGTPTYAPALSEEIIRLVKAEVIGLAHIAGDRVMSRYDFGQAIARAFDFDPGGIIASDAYPGGAPRPAKAGLLSDHDKYRPVYSHSAIAGLRELAKRYRGK
jgi:dTDP-4-dehydrorhamnose reductase